MVIVSAPLTIDAVTPGVGDGVGTGDGVGVGDGVGAGVGAGAGAGVGDGVDGEEDDPQPSESPSKTVAIVIRRAVMLPPSASFCITANLLPRRHVDSRRIQLEKDEPSRRINYVCP